MESNKNIRNNRGGRPVKSIKKDQHLAFKCSLLDRKIIERKAGSLHLTVSEYLRDMGLKGRVNTRIKTLPKEVLLLSAGLNHMASNLNQIAYRRNRGDEFNPLERASLNSLAEEIRSLAKQIKSYVQ